MPISYQVLGCFVNNSILSHPLLTKSTLFVTTFIFVDNTVTKKQLQNHSLPADLQSHLWEHFRRSYLPTPTTIDSSSLSPDPLSTDTTVLAKSSTSSQDSRRGNRPSQNSGCRSRRTRGNTAAVCSRSLSQV